jgi:hypothetical protein
MDQTTHSASSMPEKADAVPDVMKGSLDAKESPSSDDESQDEYISGLKLGLVLTALTVVYFLIMLDNTILATVRHYFPSKSRVSGLTTAGHPIHHQRLSHYSRRGMVWECIPAVLVGRFTFSLTLSYIMLILLVLRYSHSQERSTHVLLRR